MKLHGLIALTLIVGFAANCRAESRQPGDTKDAAPKIQLAILLDTSESMNGLINQARTQLWKIVNELATAKRDGEVPDLEVALYEYGKSTIPQSQGFLRQIVGLSDDLDKISAELFALKTKGGQEYCGQVIDAATRQLKWSTHDESLKLIFICGNEPFSQGEVDYKKACSHAIAKGITVSTIFCGPEAQGVKTGWQQGAQLADGSFLSINQDQQVATVKTPYDVELSQLSGQINRTFAFAGKQAATSRKRQVSADRLAGAAAPAAAAERAKFKASGKYKSEGDLVDGLKSGKLKLAELKDEELPPALQKKSLEEKQKIVKKLSDERVALSKKIQDLSQKRDEFIKAEREKQAKQSKEDTLDTAIIKAIRQQAKRKKYVISE